MTQTPHKILVVDDSHVVRDVAAQILRRRGFTVAVASSGAEALQLIRQDLPHLVLLDLEMPDMDGAETLQKIRSQRPGLPVIIVTGGASDHAMGEALKCSPHAVVPKPFTAEELLGPVRSVFRQQSPQDPDPGIES